MTEEYDEETDLGGQEQPDKSMYTPGRGGRNVSAVCLPTVKESLQMEQLEQNLMQTEDYIETFTNEKES